jgi:hypothetical protein
MGTMFELRDLPTRIHLLIAQTFECAFQGGDHARNHRILGETHFQHVQDRPIAEAGIGSHAKLPNIRRRRMKTASQQFLAARPGSRIAAAQFDIPEERSR